GELIVSIGGQVRGVDSLAMAAGMLDTDPTETLVVIGPETETNEALAFAAHLRLARPAVGVVLARDHVDVALLCCALRSGVREVVIAGDHPAGAAPPGGRPACRRSREVSRRLLAVTTADNAPAAPDGRIVTVFAAKGGCGKTTLSVNLGVALARGTGQRVCIVDLDLAFGDVAVSVQLDPARTVVDALPMT